MERTCDQHHTINLQFLGTVPKKSAPIWPAVRNQRDPENRRTKRGFSFKESRFIILFNYVD